MFVFSKIVGILLDPGWWLLGALVLALLAGRSRIRGAARLWASVALLVVAIAGLTPAGAWLLQPLEERFDVAPVSARVDGIIMLGGMIEPLVTEARGQPSLNAAAERLTEFVRLARLYPDAKLVFSGGSGAVFNQHLKESPVVRRLLEGLGLPVERVMFDAESRNTYENAVRSLQLGQPSPGERWLLLTSAMHMPRSVGCFRRVGFPVEAHPVDYRTLPDDSVWIPGVAEGFANLSAALHEWAGLGAYYLLDRTSALFPAP
jgi:uncharacterized SAM-binding protein YcdF (DUF218 family)